MGTPLVDASRSRVRTTKLLDQVFEKMWRDHGSVGLSVVLLQLLVSSQGRPQTVHEVAPGDRARVLAEFVPAAVPDCDSIFRRSLPECQEELLIKLMRQATVYGSPGQVWGELTVDVSSPVLFITKPKDLIQKRKNKNKEKEKQEGLLV